MIVSGQSTDSFLALTCPKCEYAFAMVRVFIPDWTSICVEGLRVAVCCLRCEESVSAASGEDIRKAALEAISKYVEQT